MLGDLMFILFAFIRLNCLDKSFLPRRDKPTTLKLLVYGSIVFTIALDLVLTIVQLQSCLIIACTFSPVTCHYRRSTEEDQISKRCNFINGIVIMLKIAKPTSLIIIPIVRKIVNKLTLD